MNYSAMNASFSDKADFEAEITIFTSEQGGRTSPTYNGIRWDFRYHGDNVSEGIYMIHPSFLDPNGCPVPKNQPLAGTLTAQMSIIISEMADDHRHRILVGTKFYCHEGRREVAIGKVTKLLALSN